MIAEDAYVACPQMGAGRWCDDDECLSWWPEGPMPSGWNVVVVEDRLHASCPECAAFWANEARPKAERKGE